MLSISLEPISWESSAVEKVALSPLSLINTTSNTGRSDRNCLLSLKSFSSRWRDFNEKDILWFSSDIYVLYTCWEAKVVQILSPGVVACSCNPATRRRVWGMAWGREPCWSSGHVDPASALRLASTWAPPRSRGGSGCLMRGEPGQGLKPAAKSPRGGQ